MTIAQVPPATGDDHFDRRITVNASYTPPDVGPQLAALESLRLDLPELSVTFDRPTGVARTLYNQSGYLTEADTQSGAMDIALAYVRRNVSALGLVADDLENVEIQDVTMNRTTGSTHIYLRQTYQGVPVYNGLLQININRDGRIISVNNAFHPDLAASVNTAVAAITPSTAVQSAARSIGLNNVAPAQVVGMADGTTQMRSPNLSRERVDASLRWLPIRRGDVRLVWNFQIHTLDGDDIYDMTVDATSADVWTRFDWVASDQYTVYPQPVESPNHTTPVPPSDGRVVVSNPANATASPFGWHDTNGVSGAEFTTMQGNNVHAYDDADHNDSPPSTEPDCGPSLACNFSVDLNSAPSTYRSAAVANLFYWNNVIHDVQYQYGFTEVAGNFQSSNYGNGGVGGDDVLAEAQDGIGFNNANFSTPADGSQPRMQMYLWTDPNPDRDGDFDNGIIVHEYGHGISNRLVGGPSNVNCLANPQQPGEGLSDWWALAYTAKASDTGALGRGIGTYALGQATTGVGIRAQRYSTDSSVNTWTYASINGMAIPHGVGSVWAQAAWEMYWALVDRWDFSSNLYDATGSAGNQRAMLYVNEGLMNTICSPAFTDVRDGIIQAATDNHGGEDVCRIWQAFAAFGLGVDADSGGPNSRSPTNGFALPTSCQSGLGSLSINDVSVTEGDSGTTNATFTVSLSASTTSTVTVKYATADNTTWSSERSNTAAIPIPTVRGNSSLYPSSMTVPAGFGTITKVTVVLRAFWHTWPRDVDVLLAGPTGQTVVLMSDVGSSLGVDANNLTFTFDDAGSALGTGTLSSGTYRPTNIADGEGSDTYSSPAPAAPYGTTLAGFNGTDPAGEWRLFVTDDFVGDGGSVVDGWSLQIATTTASDYVPISGTLTFSPGQTVKTLSVAINGDTNDESSETYKVNLSSAVNALISDSEGSGTIVDDDPFTDDPLSAGTVIKAVHIVELRTKIDAARADKGLSAYGWTDPTLTAQATFIKAVHIRELRTALAEAYTAAGQPLPTYTDPTLVAGMVARVAHIAEIRAAVAALP